LGGDEPGSESPLIVVEVAATAAVHIIIIGVFA
jgi:hypothetical protein